MTHYTVMSLYLVGISVGMNMVAMTMRVQNSPIYLPHLGWFLHGLALCLALSPLLGILFPGKTDAG